MTISSVIILFESLVNDVTELSDSEELALANRVYQRIANDRNWEFLKTSVAGTATSDTIGTYITAPTDFSQFSENNSYTDNSIENQNNAAPKVIFIGTNYEPYQLINYSDRRQYRNRGNYAYFDPSDSKIRFTHTPISTIYEFDYIKVPADLTLTTSPIFPARFHELVAYMMAVDNEIMQISPKATSYRAENQDKADKILTDMRWWNSQQNLN